MSLYAMMLLVEENQKNIIIGKENALCITTTSYLIIHFQLTLTVLVCDHFFFTLNKFIRIFDTPLFQK